MEDLSQVLRIRREKLEALAERGIKPFAYNYAATHRTVAVAASFELASVAYEPMLYSTGHAQYPLMIRLAAVAVLGVGIMLLSPMGPIGVGIAVAFGMAVLWVLMSATVWHVMRSLVKAEQAK